MTEQSFWREAWATEAALRAGVTTASSEGAQAVVRALCDDMTLQRYVFIHRGFGDPSWLPVFRQEGLFAAPPGVEPVQGGGVRAWGWPVLIYLRNAGPQDPGSCAEILDAISSENWWVISDGLAAAVELDSVYAARPILSLLRQWERSLVQWTQPETLGKAVDRLAQYSGARPALVEGLSRVLSRFLDDRASHYDLEDLIPEIRARIGDELAPKLADAIEESLLFKSVGTEWRAFGRSLDDLRTSDDAVDVVIREWLQVVELESKDHGAFAAFRRAVRLLEAPSALLRQMGLRALSAALSRESPEAKARALLERIAGREELTRTYDELPELLRLFGDRFDLLDRSNQAALIQRLVDQASSDDRIETIYARDWLHAIRARLSARELIVLERLTAELGSPREDFARPVAIGTFVGPRSPVTAEELASMPMGDLLGILRHVPVETNIEWPLEGGSPEGLGRLLQPLMRERIDEFWPHLGAFAEAAEYSSLLFYIAWGIRDAFASTEPRRPERLDPLLDFVSVAIERVRAGTLRRSDDLRYRDDQVARGLADLLESVGNWVVDSGRTDDIVAALEWLLESDDPALGDAEDEWSDPPTRAINSVRGEAVLAALKMRSEYWGDDARTSSPLMDGLSRLLEANLASESSPAVLSSYGRYLAAIVVYWQDFFDQYAQRLLPLDEASLPKWGAVLGTYLMFYGPHRRTAQVLKGHYELAVERLPAIEDTFLGKHADRLLMHLVALALPRADDSSEWGVLLQRALAVAPQSLNTRAIHDLAFAMEREGADVPVDWVLSFVAARTAAIAAISRDAASQRHVPKPENEPSALLELLFASRVDVQSSIGLIRSLVALGARLDVDDTIDYLIAADASRSRSGATAFLLAVQQEAIDGYMRKLDEAKTLLREYAFTERALAWEIVNAFGSHGAFTFEDVARELAEAPDASST
jgi:hypothetical protein